MHIVELTELQFKNYSNLHSRKNYKQSVEYAKLEETKGYNNLFLGPSLTVLILKSSPDIIKSGFFFVNFIACVFVCMIKLYYR